MRKKELLIVVLAGLSVLSFQVFADNVIGVNFCDDLLPPQLSGKTADGLSNWTDSYPTGIENGSNLTLLGSNDFVICDWSSSNQWFAGEEATSEQQLYVKYLDGGGGGSLVTLSGLSGWLADQGIDAYTIRVYQNTDNGIDFTGIEIKSGVGAGGTVLETIEESNHWATDGGLRAYVDSGRLTADTITVDTLPPDTSVSGSWIRSTVSAIRITGIDVFLPINPDPEIGDEVSVSQSVSWDQSASAGGLGVTYDVYFGTDPNELSPNYYGLTPVRTTTTDSADFFYAPVLSNSETYYWKADAIDPNNGSPTVHAGPEWWFATQPAEARIETDPVGMTVPAGTTEVQLSVTGINIDAYQWYKDGTPLADDLTDTFYVGEDTDTLTIYDVQVADEGFYHCEGDNSLQQPDASEAAQLLTERLIGWWKLDGNLADSVGEEIAGAVAHDGVSVDPNYVVIGKDGSAIQFYGDEDGVVTFPGSADFYNFYPRGYTVSVWVNMPTASSWAAYVSKEGIHEDTSRSGWILTSDGNGTPVHTLRQSWNDLFANTEVDDSDWHLIVGTYDGIDEGKVYVDGLLMNQATNSGTLTASLDDLRFGAQDVNYGSPYVGLLDDVRIWSYVLDSVEIASLYADFNPGSEICVENPQFDVAGPDGVGDEFRDCKVDLYDFAVFSQGWLECNVVPTCLP